MMLNFGSKPQNYLARNNIIPIVIKGMKANYKIHKLKIHASFAKIKVEHYLL